MRGLVLLIAALALPAWSDAELRFVDPRGQPVVLDPEPDRAGQPLLLHFWATWCADCVEDLAHLEQAISGCDRVRVFAVNAGDAESDVVAFIARHGLHLPVLRDPSGDVWRRLDGRGLPMNAYWPASGRKTDLGPKTREQWQALLASLGCPG